MSRLENTVPCLEADLGWSPLSSDAAVRSLVPIADHRYVLGKGSHGMSHNIYRYIHVSIMYIYILYNYTDNFTNMYIYKYIYIYIHAYLYNVYNVFIWMRFCSTYIYIYRFVHLCMLSAYGALVVDWWGYNASISITVLLNKSGIWCRLGLPEHPNPNPTSIEKNLSWKHWDVSIQILHKYSFIPFVLLSSRRFICMWPMMLENHWLVRAPASGWSGALPHLCFLPGS